MGGSKEKKKNIGQRWQQTVLSHHLLRCRPPGNLLLRQRLQLSKSGHLQQVAVGVRHLAGCIATPNLPTWTGGTWAAAALVLNAK